MRPKLLDDGPPVGQSCAGLSEGATGGPQASAYGPCRGVRGPQVGLTHPLEPGFTLSTGQSLRDGIPTVYEGDRDLSDSLSTTDQGLSEDPAGFRCLGRLHYSRVTYPRQAHCAWAFHPTDGWPERPVWTFGPPGRAG